MIEEETPGGGPEPTETPDWRAVLESAPDAVIVHDLSGRILYWNPAAERLYGYLSGEMRGKDLWSLQPEDSEDQVREALARLSRGRSCPPRDCLRRHRDGWFVEVSCGSSPLRDDRGRILGGVEVTRNVTSHKQVERELTSWGHAIKRSRVAMATGMPDGTFAYVNEAFALLHGYTPAELIGEPASILYPDGAREHLERNLEQVTSAEHLHIEMDHVRKDGSTFPVAKEIATIRDNGGRLLYLFVTVQDISGMRKAQEAAEEAREKLEERLHHVQTLQEELQESEKQLRATANELARSNADLDRFATAASHDLKEPLRMVSSYVELLAMKYGDRLDERARTYIEFAHDGAVRMQQLIDDLLAYSRVGRDTCQPCEMALDRAVSLALKNLKLALEESGGEVQVGELPRLRAVPSLMVQLYQNLIGNALKFRRSGVPPRVEIGCTSAGGTHRFWVKDNGIGIPPDHHETVFGIFKRLHPRSNYPGSGMGLAMVRRIVEYHGGQVTLESQEGQGTTVLFDLKRASGASPSSDDEGST